MFASIQGCGVNPYNIYRSVFVLAEVYGMSVNCVHMAIDVPDIFIGDYSLHLC